jgi:hypothetical protein
LLKSRTYSQLRRLPTFEDRFAYLSLEGQVAQATFGRDRWINQDFYHSFEWRRVRQVVILRDGGFDLGVPGYEIFTQLVVHHINPLIPEDFRDGAELALDPDNLITTTHRTHNAIHYGDERQLPRTVVERSPRDTQLW